MLWKKGFTMVELLVVLIILAILVAVAAPMYFGNVNRARASEAVAGMGTIRQAERDYKVSHNTYYAVASGNIENSLPTSVDASGNPTPSTAGLSISPAVTQYFANGAYSVSLTGLTAAPFNTVNAVDFVITTDGGSANNTLCAASGAPSDCAVKATEVDNTPSGSAYILKMDNSGTTYVSYNNGGNWQTY